MWLEAVAGIAFEVDLSTGAVRLTTSFTSASVPWGSGRGMEGFAGARMGQEAPQIPADLDLGENRLKPNPT
jgi:hypothetical protein